MKAFFTLAAAALAVVSGQTAPATNATRPPCIDLNFTSVAQEAKIDSLNSIIDFAMDSGMLTDGLAQVDPLKLVNQVLPANNFSVLDLQFAIVPTIKSLALTGLSKIHPDHVNITGATTLAVDAYVNGTVDLKATFSAEIIQLNKKWYQICWTNAADPIKCPSKTVDVEVAINIDVPKVAAEVNLPMKGCTPGTKASICKDISITELLAAASTQDFSKVGPRLLHRFIKVSLNDFKLSFDRINDVSFQFAKADPLLRAIGDALLDFTAAELNKHRLSYKTFTSVVNKIVKDLINKLLDEQLNPQLGATCYDN